MITRTWRGAPWAGCGLAAFCALFRPLAPAAADAPSAPPAVRGLAPSSGRGVPLALRPPGARIDESGPSLAIFPPQELPLRFSHELHTKQLGVGCTGCHERATTSRLSSDVLLPPATRCDECHGTSHRDLSRVTALGDEPRSQCAYCHLGYREGDGPRVARVRIPKPNLKFDHAAHAARNIGCGQCHGAIQGLELATRDQLPRMAGCLRCHQGQEAARGDASGACRTCHLTEPDGTLRDRFSSGVLVPPAWMNAADHDADWIRRHKLVAGADSELCAQCHTERECVDCHDGRVRPRDVHPNDWLSLHAVAAVQNDPSCTSCHRQQSFCLQCHQRAGVTMSGPFGNASSRGRFHPAGWTNGSRSTHAAEAQRNLNACVSCHTERDCTLCHATRAMGGGGWSSGIDASPHPAGFLAQCGSALRKNPRSCLVCHHPADPNLSRCD